MAGPAAMAAAFRKSRRLTSDMEITSVLDCDSMITRGRRTGDKIAGVTGSVLLCLREKAPATRSPALPEARCFACAKMHRRQDRRRYRERAALLARKGTGDKIAGVTGSALLRLREKAPALPEVLDEHDAPVVQAGIGEGVVRNGGVAG